MKTKTLRDYILSCIDTSEYDQSKFPTLKSIIEVEKGSYRLITQDVVEDWLRGLPSSVNLIYSDSDIEALLVEVGSPNLTVDGYWSWCAYHIHHFAIVEGN